MYYIGIDLGGTNIAVGIVNENAEIILKGSTPTGRERAFSEIMADMGALCEKLIADANIKKEEVGAIGIGVPGSFDKETVSVLYCSNIPSFSNVSVGDELKKSFPDAKIYIENDANAAAFGESVAGAAKGGKDVVAITLGTGVGGGIIIGGKIYSGVNNASGELGHTVISIDGAPCNCGRKGCFEAYASVTALIRETKEILPEYPESIMHEMIEKDGKISGKTAFSAMKQGDIAGKKVVDQYIKYIGVGVVNIINTFQPEKIVIGGGISKEGETILAPLREFVEKEEYTRNSKGVKRCEIVAAELGNDAGIIGAAMLFKQDL